METRSSEPQEELRQEQGSKEPINRLGREKSPYLLQHAHNPVDWYPWCEEAFEKARKENKPVFLSIGYSTCHWCHVMEAESFNDPDVAKAMNDAFVCIKVDREERPDLDGIYMDVCQMFTGRGGWPLHIIMSPDKKPFFAATYIPKETRFGVIGLIELSRMMKDSWLNQRERLTESAERCVDILRHRTSGQKGREPDSELLDSAYRELEQRFDSVNGGFGSTPKFPLAHGLLFLLRYYKRTGNLNALRIVEKTLQSIRDGGIYDHVGFGFHRYTTDAQWVLPHFEKMIYDQAMLSMAYTEAYQATDNDEYMKTAKEIFAYVMRDMTSPKGGFYSAEDADSEGEEGRFYLWTVKEIEGAVGADDLDFAKKVFNAEEAGNFFDQASG
ncbi:MAG: thioredoxin domain-containing protein, partial [Deltaproteobacteria bacterium]|nr:thioredoxin domain-containing protein [Deltaproteobacteria bacterium]